MSNHPQPSEERPEKKFRTEYLRFGLLSEQLPLVVNGQQIKRISCSCHRCGSVLPDKLVRGKVHIYSDYAVFTAIGICPLCIAPINFFDTFGAPKIDYQQ